MQTPEFISANRRVFLHSVTPELAKELLQKYNRCNRRVREDGIAYIARLMRTGLWGVSDAMICITAAGWMFNGQHRLKAAVKTGIGFEAVFMVGCPETEAMHSDDNMPKTMGDRTGTSERFSSIAKLALTVATGKSRFSAFDVMEMQDRLSAAYNEVMAFCPTIRPKFSTAPCALAVIVQLMSAAEENKLAILAGYKSLILSEEIKPASITKLVDWTTDKFRSGHGQGRFEMLAQALTAFSEKNIRLQHKPKKSMSVQQGKDRVYETVRKSGWHATTIAIKPQPVARRKASGAAGASAGA